MALIEINRDPGRSELRWFGLVLLAFLGVIGAMLRWKFDAPEAARWVWIAGVALAVIYYAVPPLRRPMFVGWMIAAFPIGWTISHVVLAIVYYLVITPIGLVMRLVGYDPMHRRFDRKAASYWKEHDPHGNAARYFRQF